MKNLNQFKIRVTPEESEVVQITLFQKGISWGDKESTVRFTENPFLVVSESCIGFLPITKFGTYNQLDCPEFTFDQFKKMYDV